MTPRIEERPRSLRCATSWGRALSAARAFRRFDIDFPPTIPIPTLIINFTVNTHSIFGFRVFLLFCNWFQLWYRYYLKLLMIHYIHIRILISLLVLRFHYLKTKCKNTFSFYSGEWWWLQHGSPVIVSSKLSAYTASKKHLSPPKMTQGQLVS